MGGGGHGHSHDGDDDGGGMFGLSLAVPCIVVSTSFVILTMFLAEAGRKITGAMLKDGLLKVR